ncbi:hypothetical protein AKJ63_01955 [candidate division MSBL1 archaeon SCGC-AAA259D18]|uniref:Sodium/calcium exchanger membrane region domain-containing protein n=1 Tax=candidate division MSBL1 archaeon SCGC-AAA259D18 TaxID=1698262 RepID=A0A133UA26_9EURY|nr:hypothetical protein AKJ63_01955 [candidate division MSBL1 archaeon SCGC-AAA259D18]
MWSHLLIIVACLLIFERASNYLVEGLGAISQNFNISEAVLGASIAAMGSSAPEFGSSVFSVIEGNPSIGLGTIVGSAIFNVTIIVGGAAIFGKYVIEKRVFYRDGLFYLFTVLIATLSILDGNLSQIEALAWFIIFIGYLAWLVYDARRGKPVPRESFEPLSSERAMIYIVLSSLAIALAARYLVDQVGILFPKGETQAIFSLIVIAAGTSVPDLFTSLQAAKKGMGSLAVSNALGSNIFDILACLGIPFSFKAAPEIEAAISTSILSLLASVIVALAILRFKWSVDRKKAILLFGVYSVFIILVLLGSF